MSKTRSGPEIMNEDTTVLPESVQNAVNKYTSTLGPVRVSELLMDYGGSKQTMARDLAGIPREGKLPAKGTDERRAYDTANRNIGRWLKAESGSGGQNRRTDKLSQERLKKSAIKVNPPSGGTVDMHGYIYYDDDIRWRHITVTLSANHVSSMLEHIQNGDTHAAYSEIFAAYGAAHLQMGSNDAHVHIDFD